MASNKDKINLVRSLLSNKLIDDKRIVFAINLIKEQSSDLKIASVLGCNLNEAKLIKENYLNIDGDL